LKAEIDKQLQLVFAKILPLKLYHSDVIVAQAGIIFIEINEN